MMLRAFLIGTALASSLPAMAQQERMADCNKQASAKGMKGDERKKFMSECPKA